MKKVLVVVDMQNDFVDGALGSAEAQAIVHNVCKKIEEFQGDLYVTFDTHYENYMQTLEGKKLPVPHCIEGSEGHALHPQVAAALAGKAYTPIIKKTFGSFEIAEKLQQTAAEEMEIELVGLCTDICVISNALILRAAFPNTLIRVDQNCCAGVSEQTHEAALSTMRCYQIDIV